jgi:hypothetical protein
MMDEKNAGRAAGEVLRRRGIALSSYGIDRFLYARRRLSTDPRVARHPTLAECATRARVGLRTLTRCLRGERVDRRSIELIFLGVGLELGPKDILPGYLDAVAFARHGEGGAIEEAAKDCCA